MSAAKHTAGPWFNTSEDDRPTGSVGTTPLKNDVALCWGENAKPDAQLIAAATDLLDACKAQHKAIDLLMAMLLEKDNDFRPTKSAVWPTVLQGNKAIAKATGGEA